MASLGLTLNPELSATTRLRAIASSDLTASARDWVILISAGAAAACASIFIEMRLGIPGSAILRVVFPMTMGLALVPRRGAGCVMGAAAAMTAGGLKWSGFGGDGPSVGAMTSLIATGPLLDLALHRSRGGWRLYASFAAAGFASNALAFLTRGGVKASIVEHLTAKPLDFWLSRAPLSYSLCGLLAGFFSAAIFFYASRRADQRGAGSGDPRTTGHNEEDL